MITRKPKSRRFTRIWPYTPDPSPPLEATEIHISVDDDFKMASEPSRPISVVSKKDSAILSPAYRPTLDDVLNGTAPTPYTLAAFTAFLSQQHCLETLEFVTEAKKYAAKYDDYAATYHGMPLTTDCSEGFELQQDWLRILDVYVKPGAPREINLQGDDRNDLVKVPYEPKPPRPEALDPAIQRMRDLMSDSIFIPFCHSVRASSPPATYSSAADFSPSYDDRGPSSRRSHSTRRRSPPTSSGIQPSRSPPQTSNRTSILMGRNSSSRLSQHQSNASATSEGALTDDSGSGASPIPGELDSAFSPPLTPPTSEVYPVQQTPATYSHAGKQSRNESRWKMMKIFNTKKKSSFPQDE